MCQVDWTTDPSNATHILRDSTTEGAHQVDSKQAYRTIALDGNRALLHFCGRPASYDRWVINREDLAPPPPPSSAPEAATLQQPLPRGRITSVAWLEQSAFYNELLEEVDFDDHGSSPTAADVGTAERASHASHALPTSPKLKRPLPDELDTLEGLSTKKVRLDFDPVPQATQPVETTNGHATTPVGAAAAPPPTQPPEPTNDVSVEPAATIDTSSHHPEPIVEPQQGESFVIPIQASWFSLDRIHPIERRSVPEYFGKMANRSKTPTIYQTYRNFMVQTYRLNPLEYLTLTACRRNLRGDVFSLLRIHTFLDTWGIINYQALGESRPQTFGPPYTGHFRVTVDVARGLGNVGTKPKTVHQATILPSVDTDAFIRGADFMPAQDPSGSTTITNADQAHYRQPPVRPLVHYSCDTCGIDCTRTRYVLLSPLNDEQADHSWCILCYDAGRFPPSITFANLIKVEYDPCNPLSGGVTRLSSTSDKSTLFSHLSNDDGESNWSDLETLYLLGAIQKHGTSWETISNAIGTRSPSECALRFLQLPIEDRYLTPSSDSSQQKLVGENGDDSGGIGFHPSSLGPYGLMGQSRFAAPFNVTDNPVLSVLTVLASLVRPEVVQHATQRALLALDHLVSEGTERRANEVQLAKARTERGNTHVDHWPQDQGSGSEAMATEQKVDQEHQPDPPLATDGEHADPAKDQTAAAAASSEAQVSTAPSGFQPPAQPEAEPSHPPPEAGRSTPHAHGQKDGQPTEPDKEQAATDTTNKEEDKINPVTPTENDAKVSTTDQPSEPTEPTTSPAEHEATKAQEHWSRMSIHLTNDERQTQATLQDVVEQHAERSRVSLVQFQQYEARLVEQRQRLAQQRANLYSDRLNIRSQLQQLGEILQAHHKAQQNQQYHHHHHQQQHQQQQQQQQQPPPPESS